MLPQYGGYGGHGGRRGGKGGANPLLLATGVFGLSTIVLFFMYYSAHSKAGTLGSTVKQLQSSVNQLHEQLDHQRSLYQHMEYEYHNTQRRVNDLTRDIQQKDHMLQMKKSEKDEFSHTEAQMQAVIKQLQEQLEYEQAIIKVHVEKIEQLEKAHNQREADWRELSKTWAKFEADANKENQRLLLELAKATQAAGGTPSPASTPSPHVLPDAEPKTRPDNQFNTHVELPKEDQFVHHYKLADEYIKQHREFRIPRINMPNLENDIHSGAQLVDTPRITSDHGAAIHASHTQNTPASFDHLGGMEGSQGLHHGASGQQGSARNLQAETHLPVPHSTGMAAHHTPDPHQASAHPQQGTTQASQTQQHGPVSQHPSPVQPPHVVPPQTPHSAPSPVHAHHGHMYDDHHWSDDVHLDPLDHYWIHDNWDATVHEPHHDAYSHGSSGNPHHDNMQHGGGATHDSHGASGGHSWNAGHNTHGTPDVHAWRQQQQQGGAHQAAHDVYQQGHTQQQHPGEQNLLPRGGMRHH